MLRTVGRPLYRRCSKRAAPLPREQLGLAASSRRFLSAQGESRLAELATKDEFLNFPRDRSVLYFTAKWCPPCRRIGPVFAELSEETPSVSFGKVDIDENMDAARMEQIMSVPTFKFYKDGKEVDVISGADANMVEHAVAKLAES